MAIKSFSHKGLEKFFLTGSKAGIQAQQASRLSRQLAALNVATHPQQMNVPGWDFHYHKGGSFAGHYAVSVNGNWRVTFKFEGADAVEVNYVDYH